jgi:hypothetical protein
MEKLEKKEPIKIRCKFCGNPATTEIKPAMAVEWFCCWHCASLANELMIEERRLANHS